MGRSLLGSPPRGEGDYLSTAQRRGQDGKSIQEASAREQQIRPDHRLL